MLLQVILEGLFDKIKAQSNVINSLHSVVEKLRGDEEVDPVDRIRLLERRMNEMFGEPGSEPRLSPFKQQELLDRVDHLEATVAAQADEIRGMRGEDVRSAKLRQSHVQGISHRAAWKRHSLACITLLAGSDPSSRSAGGSPPWCGQLGRACSGS